MTDPVYGQREPRLNLLMLCVFMVHETPNVTVNYGDSSVARLPSER
jgi:hypothetical protein